MNYARCCNYSYRTRLLSPFRTLCHASPSPAPRSFATHFDAFV